MNKHFLLIIFLYLSAFGQDFDICSTNQDVCTDINNLIITLEKDNISIKKKILTISQISRYSGILSEYDNNKIKKILGRIKTYESSIFNNKTTFAILAEKCNKKIYFVEAFFDVNYNVHFNEKIAKNISFSTNDIIIDNEEYYLKSDEIKLIYQEAFNGIYNIIEKKTQKHDRVTISNTLRLLCFKEKYNGASLKIRSNSNLNQIIDKFVYGDKLIQTKPEMIKHFDERTQKTVSYKAYNTTILKCNGESITGYITAHEKYYTICE